MASWFSQIASTVTTVTGIGASVQEVHPVANTAENGVYFSKLAKSDLEWTLEKKGTPTENQVFYVTTKSGGFAMVQLIHSNVAGPTISFTCRFYDPASNLNYFKTFFMSKFELSEDRCSVKTDNFNITLDPTQTTYKIGITHPELVVSLEFTRVDRGFKVGGGKTYLGGNEQTAAGYVSHKFWPRAVAKGTFIVNQTPHEVDGNGMFIHAIQGMLPYLIASNWNFVNFQGPEAALSIMQFKTTKQYSAIDVSQGSLVLNDKLVCVSVENNVELLDLIKDEDTGYQIPQKIKITWKGKTIPEEGSDEATSETKDVNIEMVVAVKNQLDKIDVIGEIPYYVKKFVQTMLKPYIYQWLDTATAEITIGGEKTVVEGKCFQELVLVSDF